MRYVVLTTDGRAEVHEGELDTARMQSIVGGWLEIAPCPHPQLVVWVNEEGKLSQPPMPVNRLATALCWERLGTMDRAMGILGQVLVTSSRGTETSSLTDDELAALADRLGVELVGANA